MSMPARERHEQFFSVYYISDAAFHSAYTTIAISGQTSAIRQFLDGCSRIRNQIGSQRDATTPLSIPGHACRLTPNHPSLQPGEGQSIDDWLRTKQRVASALAATVCPQITKKALSWALKFLKTRGIAQAELDSMMPRLIHDVQTLPYAASIQLILTRVCATCRIPEVPPQDLQALDKACLKQLAKDNPTVSRQLQLVFGDTNYRGREQLCLYLNPRTASCIVAETSSTICILPFCHQIPQYHFQQMSLSLFLLFEKKRYL